jgi:hypothetical protein
MENPCAALSERVESCIQELMAKSGRYPNTVTGLKIHPQVESVGRGFGTLFTNFDWGRSMGAKGRRAAETEFTCDIIAKKTEQSCRSGIYCPYWNRNL